MPLQVSYIVGPLIASVVFNAFLFGIYIMQFITYLRSGFGDRWLVMSIVYQAVILDMFHTVSLTRMLWVYVQNFNNIAMLSATPRPFPAVAIVTTYTPFFIYLFYFCLREKFS
jgi:hypothetical protein